MLPLEGVRVIEFCNVAAGPYTVSVSGLSADYACPQTQQAVTVAGGQTTAVQFACNLVQTASIAGSVSNTNGSAFSGASITITRTAPTPAGTPVTVKSPFAFVVADALPTVTSTPATR